MQTIYFQKLTKSTYFLVDYLLGFSSTTKKSTSVDLKLSFQNILDRGSGGGETK